MCVCACVCNQYQVFACGQMCESCKVSWRQEKNLFLTISEFFSFLRDIESFCMTVEELSQNFQVHFIVQHVSIVRNHPNSFVQLYLVLGHASLPVHSRSANFF